MTKLLLVREIYVEAFKGWTYRMLQNSFKFYSWFCFALLAIVFYAFAYRVATGFAF